MLAVAVYQALAATRQLDRLGVSGFREATLTFRCQ